MEEHQKCEDAAKNAEARLADQALSTAQRKGIEGALEIATLQAKS